MAEKTMKDLLRPPGDSDGSGRSLLVGPEAGLLAVLDAYEALAHAGAEQTWEAFTAAYDWTSPVERALPAPDAAGLLPTATPYDTGRLVSGRWELPGGDRQDRRWLTLPVPPAAGTADPSPAWLFAVPAEALLRYGTRVPTADGFTMEVVDFYVPAGLSRPAAAPGNRVVTAEFVGVGVAAMALGATRRMAALIGDRAAEEELAGLLTNVRKALRQVLGARARWVTTSHGAASWERDLGVALKRVEAVARHAMAVAYGASSESFGAGEGTGTGDGGNEEAKPLALWSASLLQNLRFSADLLPEDRLPDPDIQRNSSA